MPNPNAIVALITRVEPPLVEFEGERTARLDPADRRSRGFAEILEELRRMRAPAYVEVEGDTRAIARLLIPLVARVANILLGESSDALIDLEVSHARHVLKRANPEFETMLRALRDALANSAWLTVTETDDHEIIDVRPSRHPPEPVRGEPKGVLAGLWRWLKWLLRCLMHRCVKPKKAEEMFNLVSAQSCNPTTVPPPCIPFLYPDDGCWARAHEMCRLMIAAGVTPRNVWIFGSLHANTRNNPNCQVFWGWHVAPTLCIKRKRFGPIEETVIDPSLFTGPVSKPTWKGVQGDPNAQLKASDASAYFHASLPFQPKTDPTYTQTVQDLNLYRLKLKNRSLQFGPPPYANCP